MRLVLIRHAESTWNASGRWQGQSDVPLSPRGQLQVRALASRLWELEADRLICSDLQRAQHTAMAIGDPEPDPRFREIDVGEWAGLKRSEVAERFAEQVRARDLDLYDHDIALGVHAHEIRTPPATQRHFREAPDAVARKQASDAA